MTKDSDQTSSHLASLVSLSVSQVKEGERMMTEISGKKLLELSKSPKFLFLLEKMLMELLNSISTPYLRTWKVQTTPQGALIFQLRASVQNTKDKESGLLRTPTTQDSRIGMNNIGGHQHRMKRGSTALADQILFPTPTQDSASERKKKYKQGGIPLTVAVQMLPTLTNSEHKYRLKGNTQASNCLEAKARKTGGRLNPNFVEFLMGYQQNWTKIESTESKLSETQSFHKSHTTSDLPLKKLWRTPTAMDGQINNEEKYAARILKGKTTRKSKEKVQINLATEVQVEKLRNDPARVDELLADEMIKRTKLPSQKEFVEYIRSQTNPQELSKLSGIKFSTVEHWFRRGKYFSHPSIEDWNKIKVFLKEIKFDEELTFTESIEWE